MYHNTALLEKAPTLDVNGYVLKEFALEEIKDCFEQLRYKKQWLSPHLSDLWRPNRQLQMMRIYRNFLLPKKIIFLIARRKTSKQIAGQHFISEKQWKTTEGTLLKGGLVRRRRKCA